MGLVSLACVCVGEIPYSLVPLAVFLYVTLPTRSARRRIYVRRLSPSAPAARVSSPEERRALLDAAERAVRQGECPAAGKAEAVAARCVMPTVLEETFEETFN
jgi:hypothetical protein